MEEYKSSKTIPTTLEMNLNKSIVKALKFVFQILFTIIA